MSPFLGLYGAVIARAASISVLFLFALYQLRKELPPKIDREGLIKGLVAGVSLIPTTLYIEYGIALPNDFIKLGLELVVALTCYVSALLINSKGGFIHNEYFQV